MPNPTSFQHVLQKVWKSPGATTITSEKSITANTEINEILSVPNGSTNLHFVFTIVSASLQALFIHADQNLTIKTNSSSAPDNTINLKANRAVQWVTGDAETNPIGAATVTSIYVTNASGEDTVIQLRALVTT